MRDEKINGLKEKTDDHRLDQEYLEGNKHAPDVMFKIDTGADPLREKPKPPVSRTTVT